MMLYVLIRSISLRCFHNYEHRNKYFHEEMREIVPFLIETRNCPLWIYALLFEFFECLVILHAFLSSADFIFFFKSTILSGLIWVQTACKEYQHLDDTCRQKANKLPSILIRASVSAF